MAEQMLTQLVLDILAGPEAGRKLIVAPGKTSIVGRSPDVDHSLSGDRYLSSGHFSLEFTDAGWLLRDLESRHGTQVNGQLVQQASLDESCEIIAGSCVFSVRLEEFKGDRAAPAAASQAAPSEGPTADGSQMAAPVAAAAIAGGAAGLGVWAKVANAPTVRAPKKPPKYEVLECHTKLALLRGAEKTPSPASIAWLLAQQTPMHLLADFSKVKLPVPESLGKATFLFNWMDDDVLPHCSPALISPGDPVDPYGLIDKLWGEDALLCLFTKLPRDQLILKLRAAIRRDDGTKTTVPKGILGYCWPEAGRALLFSGGPKLLDPLTSIVDIFLLEAEAPDCWEVYCPKARLASVEKSLGKS